MSFLLLAIRVTHSEVIESLETDSVINTLRRFISRRGMPKMIRSDNGTNLSSGDREIREAVNNWNQQKIGFPTPEEYQVKVYSPGA